jgi:hypothetical protein
VVNNTEIDIVAEFKADLDDWKFPIRHYLLLETIFRHAFTALNGQRTLLEGHIDLGLLPAVATTKERVDSIQLSLREESTSPSYGFEIWNSDGFNGQFGDKLTLALLRFRSDVKKIRRLASEAGIASSSIHVRAFINAYQKKLLQTETLLGKPGTRRVINFEGMDRDSARSDEHLPFFAQFFNLGHAVFNPYFLLIERHGERSQKGNNIYRFLSNKARMHTAQFKVQKLDFKSVKMRLEGNPSARGKAKKAFEEQGLVDSDFYEYLIGDNSFLKGNPR